MKIESVVVKTLFQWPNIVMESHWNEKGLEMKKGNEKRAYELFVFDFWNFKLVPID